MIRPFGIGRRLIAATVIVALISCGKKTDTSSSAGSGSSTAAGGRGSAVGSGDATITLPAGMAGTAVTVVVKPRGERPPAVKPYTEMLDMKLRTIKVVELGPDGTTLPASGIVTVTIDPADLAGRPLSDLAAVSVSADGTLEDVPLTTVGSNQVKVEVKHFSWLMLLMPILLMSVVGGMALYMKGASESIGRKNCGDWITPESPRIAELAKDETRFSIDKATGAIHLDPALKGKDVDQGAHMLKADQVLDKGVGDCVNMSTVLGSLLAARGYPVKLVAGAAHYTSGGKDVQGFHQWAETVIDGKPYYVDTFNPSAMKLVPLHEATTELALVRARMCGKDGGAAYNANWYDEHEAAPGEDWVKLKAELDDLLEQHKTLNKMCIASPTNDACAERKRVYDRAKAIQDKLKAMGK